MALIDRMRIVEIRNTVPYTVLDLMDGSNFTHIKGQFSTVRPAKTRAAVTGARRFDGDRIAFEKMGNAAINCQWMIGAPGSTQDASMALMEHLGQVFEDATSRGRMIEVRFAGNTKSVFYEPRGTPDWNLQNYDPLQVSANGVYQASATIPVAPLANGAQMDVQDSFLTDTISAGDYIKDGTGGLQVIGTALAPVTAGARARYRHARGYAYTDAEVRLTIQTSANITNARYGIFMAANQSGIDTKLALELDQALGQCQLVTYFAGTRTVVQSFAVGVVANTIYLLRLLSMGDIVYAMAQVANNSGGPQVLMPSDYEQTYYHSPWALTGAQLAFQRGDCGIDITSGDINERYDDFAIRPYSYYQIGTPEQLRLSGIPGTAPAAVDFEVTTNDTGAVGQPPVWADLAWSERPIICNLLNNGDFESAPPGADGWSHAALTNYVNTAATSHTRDGTASRYGAASLQIVTPASVQSGVSNTIYHRLKANRQYAAFGWAKSAAQTTSLAIKLGAPGAGGATTGPAKALSALWQLYSCTFRTSTALTDYDQIVVGFATQAATATTFNIDGVVVVEVGTVTLAAAIASTTATALTVYSTPGETPSLRPDGTLNGPFLIVIDQEMMRVTAINPATNTWTVERGVEQTTAATHAVDAPVIIAPPLRPHLEGRGAHSAFGIIEGEAYAQEISNGGASTLSIASGASLRGSNTAQITWANGTAPAMYYYVDPNTLVPDDFTLGEVDVEVFARVNFQNAVTATILMQAEPTERYSGLVLAGRKRYTREYGATAKALVTPSTAAAWRIVRLGTLPMAVDPQNPQRWRIRLTPTLSVAGATFYIDYLMVAPVRYRACLPTGKVDDGGATYPSFIPYDPNWGTGSAMTKIFRADGSALIRNPIPPFGRYNLLPPAFPDHGFGKQLQFPTGDVDVYMKLSDTIPDDPSVNNAQDMSGGASASWVSTLRAMVTPRYYVGRGGA